jgi:hypothetical protein
VALVAAAPDTERQPPQQYFRCATNHTLSVHPNGVAARCVATVLLTSDPACPSGQIKVHDIIYLTDVCATVGSGSPSSYGCPPGYSVRVQSGADVCEKTTTSIRPVDVATTVFVTHHE